MKSSLRYGLVLTVILLAGIFINCWAYLGEARVERKELKDFPQQLGDWAQVGNDQRFDSQTLAVLKASDYLLRNYRTADGQVANFYVGYYATQRDGATYHSPLNCLPGSGWTMSDPGQITITSPNGQAFVANRYLVQNGDQKSLLVYWYQGRGRTVASEYWGKVYTVWDSVRLRRSDGAMVRITVPIGNSDSTALRSASDLAASATSVLPQFVPD
ncbi:MAG: exosortase C-terminal domain/associated protein EpsI [Pyrinomonadaceae bacterium]